MVPFLLASLLLNIAIVSGGLFTARANRALGRVIHREPAPLAGRLLGTAFCVIAGLAAWLNAPTVEEVGSQAYAWPQWFVMLPFLTVVALWSQPSPKASACGENGVRFGDRWSAYRDVESWRLTGEHLRCQLGGRWHALPVPVELHPELRGFLEREAGSRENEFNV